MRSIVAMIIMACIGGRLGAITMVPNVVSQGYSVQVTGSGFATVNVYGSPAIGNEVRSTASPGTTTEGNVLYTALRPNVQYYLDYYFYSDDPGSTVSASFVAPDGYAIYIDGVQTNVFGPCQPTSDSNPVEYHTIVLRPVSNMGMGPFGSFAGISIGEAVEWRIGLGMTATGASAGWLLWNDVGLNNAAKRSQPILVNTSGAAMTYDLYPSQDIHEIITTQGSILFSDDSGGGGYKMQFYSNANTVWNPATNQYDNTGSPWKTVHVQSDGSASLTITETEGAVSHVYELRLLSGSPSTLNPSWRLREGDGATWMRTTTHATTVNSSTFERDEVVTIYTGNSQTVVSKTKYHYDAFARITSVVIDPDGAGLATNYTYYADSSARGNYGRVKTVTYPSGNWTTTAYYDDFARRGRLKYEQHPYLDSPSMAPASIDPTSSGSGRVMFHDYAANWLGYYVLPSVDRETINGVITAQTTYANGTISDPSLPRSTIDVYAYRDAANSGHDYSEVYREDAVSSDDYSAFRPGLPVVSKSTDGTQTSYNSGYGTYNATSKSFTYNASSDYFRELVVHGTTDATAGTQVSAFVTAVAPAGQPAIVSQPFTPIYLVPNRSTVDVNIHDRSGLTVRSETWVYTGATGLTAPFAMLTYQNRTFDDAGRLLQTVDNNDSTITNTYTNGQLVKTIDAMGAETDYSYDPIGQIHTMVKKGTTDSMDAVLTPSYQYAAQPDITTTYTYDGVGHVIQEVMDGGVHSLTTKREFDLAGRPTKQIDPGSYETDFAYSSGGRILTSTLPGGATKILETYPDGRQKQISGTGVVGVVYSYSVDSATGNQQVKEVDGGLTASWVSATADWLGRTIAQTAPGWNGTAVVSSWHYNAAGQLDRTSQPGFADMLYIYDAMGVLYRKGLHLGSGSTLDLKNDRITETTISTYIDNSGRAARQIASKVYAASGSSTPKTINTSTDYLSNLGSGVVSYGTQTDIYGNTTSVTVAIDRANKLLTKTLHTSESSIDAKTITYNGLAVEVRDSAGDIVRREYDDLGRRVRVIDPRTGTTTSSYVSGSNQILSVSDARKVEVASYTYDSTGRVATVKNALRLTARYEYTMRGQRFHEWGDTPYPVEYGYDTVGRMISQKTYRGGTGWEGAAWPTATTGTADQTQWFYDDGTHTGDHGTGLLSSKLDASGHGATFTYTQAGQIHERIWSRFIYQNNVPRFVTSTYGYDANTGELASINYNDGTPAVSYNYNRLGQMVGVEDVTTVDHPGTHTLNYNTVGTLELQNEQLPAFAGGRVITWKYDTATTGALGRDSGFKLGQAGNLGGDCDVTLGYDAYGRFNNLQATLAGASAASSNFAYTYVTDSNLVGTVQETNSGLRQTRSYEAHRDLASGIATTLGTRALASYSYQNDDLGRRIAKAETGEMYSRYGPGLVTKYGYNARSELMSAQTYLGTDSTIGDNAAGDALQGRNYHYAYDSIGNRVSTTTNGQGSIYTTNNVNEIQSRTVPGYIDVSGFATANSAVTVGDQPTTRQFDYFYRQQPLNNSQGPLWSSLMIGVASATAISETRTTFLAGATESFSYDSDGKLIGDGRWSYGWDAENRLVSMVTNPIAVIAGAPAQTIQFKYDYQGRRVEKLVYNGTALVTDIRFVYATAGWHLLGEYDALNGNALIRAYAWGLDLSGTSAGAGGVGGLLAIRDTARGKTYLPVYDANGNVFALINQSTAAIAATYEYDGFGNTIRAGGSDSFAAANPFRFSTKYTDAETQLIYYGNRFYSPTLGRWLSRDPKEELAGLHLYAFLNNNAIDKWDYLGWNSDGGFGDDFGGTGWVESVMGISNNPSLRMANRIVGEELSQYNAQVAAAQQHLADNKHLQETIAAINKALNPGVQAAADALANSLSKSLTEQLSIQSTEFSNNSELTASTALWASNDRILSDGQRAFADATIQSAYALAGWDLNVKGAGSGDSPGMSASVAASSSSGARITNSPNSTLGDSQFALDGSAQEQTVDAPSKFVPYKAVKKIVTPAKTEWVGVYGTTMKMNIQILDANGNPSPAGVQVTEAISVVASHYWIEKPIQTGTGITDEKGYFGDTWGAFFWFSSGYITIRQTFAVNGYTATWQGTLTGASSFKGDMEVQFQPPSTAK